MHTFIRRAAGALVLLGACSPAPAATPAVQGPADLKAAAQRMYQTYGEALTTPLPEAIGGFYHPEGATIVLNGVAQRMTRDAIGQRYRSAWTPPAFFAWEQLGFDSLAPGQVLVTGKALWQSKGQADTSVIVYAALLMAADSSLGIRFEHETVLPRR